MDHFVRSVRFAGVGAVGGLTLLTGAALVWYFVQPEMLPLLSTWQLGAILGMFILPLLCFAMWQADRKVAASAPVRRERLSVTASASPSVAKEMIREAPVRRPLIAPTPLLVAPTSVASPDADPIPEKGSGRLGHRPRQPRRGRSARAPAHRHRRFADV
jgi:hypothetical protein